ncbi:MAG: hypothetical protein JWQ40_4919 [Segetibacter sp.]|nr:hypothetical protein [Segetibacter sp.]
MAKMNKSQLMFITQTLVGLTGNLLIPSSVTLIHFLTPFIQFS